MQEITSVWANACPIEQLYTVEARSLHPVPENTTSIMPIHCEWKRKQVHQWKDWKTPLFLKDLRPTSPACLIIFPIHCSLELLDLNCTPETWIYPRSRRRKWERPSLGEQPKAPTSKAWQHSPTCRGGKKRCKHSHWDLDLCGALKSEAATCGIAYVDDTSTWLNPWHVAEWSVPTKSAIKRSKERIHPPTLSNMEDTPKFKAEGKQLTKALFPPAGPWFISASGDFWEVSAQVSPFRWHLNCVLKHPKKRRRPR